eukprot:356128-Pyramimonas_sp.AAC.1
MLTRVKCARNSVLPLAAPLMGDSMASPLARKPNSCMPLVTFSITCWCTAGSRTSPPFPT